jgi:hypothetical protein
MPLHQSTVASSEVYNTELEGLLIELGFRFAGTDRGPGKRCVREVDGISAEVNRRFSARRSAIETRVGELAKACQNQHGREPTVTEFIALSQQATLETRAAKHEPRSLGEQHVGFGFSFAAAVVKVRFDRPLLSIPPKGK